MRGLRAAITKDLKLFFSKTGFVTLLLPLVLLLALEAAGGSLIQQAYVKPFPIAVRDEDNTVMSRSLITQMREITLFSEVVELQPEEKDDSLLNRGYAAVITIPKDFFYDMYSMKQDVVSITLNDDMPLETSLFSSIISSVMEMVRADQAEGRTVFRFCFGELSTQEERMMWRSTSEQLFKDAMGRHKVFEDLDASTEIRYGIELGFFACALSLMCLIFSFSAVRTVPEEVYSGVLPRFISAGGKLKAFFLSKFIAALIMMVPSLALLLVFFRPEKMLPVLVLSVVLFAYSFGLLLCVVVWAGEEGAAQRWCNFVILLSLLLGGALYASELLPDFAQMIGRLTVPYYARMGLKSIANGESLIGLLQKLLPVIGIGILFTIAALPGILRNTKQRVKYIAHWHGEEPVATMSVLGTWNRLCMVTMQKIKAMSGGIAGIICLLLTVSICGGITAYVLGHNGAEELRVAVVLEEDGKMAHELIERLGSKDGVSLQIVNEREGNILLERGNVEGILQIGEEYDNAIWHGDNIPISYRGAEASASVQAAREIVAGEVIAQMAGVRALTDAEAILKRPLTENESEQLLEKAASEVQQTPPLYKFSMKSGHAAVVKSPFAFQQIGFMALVVMLTLLTWGAWTGSIGARRVELRIFALPQGRHLAYVSDVLALCLIGLIVGVCSMLPSGCLEVMEWAALSAYVWCVTGFTLALTRMGIREGRIDALAPFLVMVTCLIGGCFGNIDDFSASLRTLSFFTPQGLVIRAQTGDLLALAVLLVAGGILLKFGAPPKDR